MPFFNLVQICTGFSRSVRYRVYPVNHTLKMTRGPIITARQKIMAPAASYLVYINYLLTPLSKQMSGIQVDGIVTLLLFPKNQSTFLIKGSYY